MRLCLGEASKKGEKKEKKPPPGGWRCILQSSHPARGGSHPARGGSHLPGILQRPWEGILCAKGG